LVSRIQYVNFETKKNKAITVAQNGIGQVVGNDAFSLNDLHNESIDETQDSATALASAEVVELPKALMIGGAYAVTAHNVGQHGRRAWWSRGDRTIEHHGGVS
jgi:hypothetical protein